ncbi:MAG: hypothetical protein IPN18_03030 [Ignavibacteriales bacterium]|nr:hypothetical protein [Ignavibacteriales bacterium]
MRKKITIILIFLIVFGAENFAERRYVSKTGTSTPPYTSWETAADSIMKAMNLSIQGDSIIVGEGVFTEIVRFNRGVTLIGMGWESTIIKLIPDSSYAVILKDQCEIKNLKVEGNGLMTFTEGIFADRNPDENLNVWINNVKVSNFFVGISLQGFYNLLADTNYISNCIVDSCKQGNNNEFE